jgi:hypothetical protein
MRVRGQQYFVNLDIIGWQWFVIDWEVAGALMNGHEFDYENIEYYYMAWEEGDNESIHDWIIKIKNNKFYCMWT